MADESSRIHKALAMGALVFAIFGGIGGSSPANYTPPPPVATVMVDPDEQQAQKAAPAIANFDVKEVPAGTPPTGLWRVEVTGPAVAQDFHLAVPVNRFTAFSWAKPRPPAAPSQAPESQIPVSYQPGEGAAHLKFSVTQDQLSVLMSDWSGESLDLSQAGVTGIKITPANDYRGLPHLLTLDPGPRTESEFDYAKLLDVLAAVLSIADTVSKQVKERRKGGHAPEARAAQPAFAVENGALLSTAENGVRETVLTKEDLEKTQDNDRRLIATWAASIQNLFTQWTAAYPPAAGSADPKVNAELDRLQSSLCRDLTRLRQYIEGTGRKFVGFAPIEAICRG